MGASTGINFIRHITSFSPSFVASPPSLSVLPWSSPTLILPLIVHIRFPSGVTHCCCCCRCRQDHRHHYHHRHQRQHHAYNYHRQCNGQYHQLPSPNPSINTTRHPFSGKLCQNTTRNSICVYQSYPCFVCRCAPVTGDVQFSSWSSCLEAALTMASARAYTLNMYCCWNCVILCGVGII